MTATAALRFWILEKRVSISKEGDFVSGRHHFSDEMSNGRARGQFGNLQPEFLQDLDRVDQLLETDRLSDKGIGTEAVSVNDVLGRTGRGQNHDGNFFEGLHRPD